MSRKQTTCSEFAFIIYCTFYEISLYAFKEVKTPCLNADLKEARIMKRLYASVLLRATNTSSVQGRAVNTVSRPPSLHVLASTSQSPKNLRPKSFLAPMNLGMRDYRYLTDSIFTIE